MSRAQEHDSLDVRLREFDERRGCNLTHVHFLILEGNAAVRRHRLGQEGAAGNDGSLANDGFTAENAGVCINCYIIFSIF